MQFKDKIVLITGSASGIGRATALAFAKEGATVIVSDINEKGGQKTVAALQEGGSKAVFIKADVTDFAQVENLIAQIVAQFGRLDIAINNAGISGSMARTADVSLDNWHQVMNVNTNSVFYCLKVEIQQMLQQGAGIIINVASIAGLKGLPNSLPYTASKHAVVGMTKTAAMEYARKNIRVNAICPVFTVTPMFNPEMMDTVRPGLADKLKNNIPMNRFAKVEEMANTILWLSSDKASFVTGVAMPVDGGLTA